MKQNTKLTVAVSSILFWILLGTILFRAMESWTWIQAFYFSVISLTTVGYGDLHPTTDLSRLVTALYLLIGVSIVVASLGIIGAGYLQHREEKAISRQQRNEAKTGPE
jgi:ABC-type phosphate transport system permease subunit